MDGIGAVESLHAARRAISNAAPNDAPRNAMRFLIQILPRRLMFSTRWRISIAPISKPLNGLNYKCANSLNRLCFPQALVKEPRLPVRFGPEIVAKRLDEALVVA